jgi:hypothetical protein
MPPIQLFVRACAGYEVVIKPATALSPASRVWSYSCNSRVQKQNSFFEVGAFFEQTTKIPFDKAFR